MTTVAFKMRLKAGQVEEYKKRHDELWPELASAIHDAGISDYSIFLDEETLTLFATRKQSPDNTADQLHQHPVVRKWWEQIAPLMETNPDNSPVCTDLRRVFHLA